jgi:hypothetical protein
MAVAVVGDGYSDAGAQTTINNQLKAVTAMATEMATMTVTTMTMEQMVTVAAEARWQHL